MITLWTEDTQNLHRKKDTGMRTLHLLIYFLETELNLVCIRLALLLNAAVNQHFVLPDSLKFQRTFYYIIAFNWNLSSLMFDL